MIEFQVDVAKLLKILDKKPDEIDTTMYDERIRRKAETARQWQAKNPEKVKESAKRSYNLHKAYYREKSKRYYAEHKARLQVLRRAYDLRRRPVINATLRERYATDPEYRTHKLALNAASYRRNRDKYLAYAKEYRSREAVKARRRELENMPERREQLRKYKREYHLDRYANDSDFRERSKERAKAYYQRNREKCIARAAARRARIKARKIENETPAS